MRVYEIRGIDYSDEEVRERDVPGKLCLQHMNLLTANIPHFTFTTRDGLDGICYIDFTGNLTVVTD